MANIFISYRRADSASETGRICDRLRSRFGEDEVFIDIETVPLGMDFRQFVEEKVDRCRVALVIIGDHWAGVDQGTGVRRIDNQDDMVRVEVETALRRNIPVIPVLVGNSPVPSEADLPEELKPLSFRNGVEVRSDASFEGQMSRLIKAIEDSLPEAVQPQAPQPQLGVPKVLLGVLITLLLGALGAWVYAEWIADPEAETASDQGQSQDQGQGEDQSGTVVYFNEGEMTMESGESYNFMLNEFADSDYPQADFVVHGGDGIFALELPRADPTGQNDGAFSGMVSITGADFDQPETCETIEPSLYLSGRIPIKFEQSYCLRMRSGEGFATIFVEDMTVDEVTLQYAFLETVVEEFEEENSEPQDDE